MKPKAIHIVGYGINCEEETAFAFEKAGAESKFVHINDLIEKKNLLDEAQILVFPGGFSYGDDTGSGKALANKIRNRLSEEILKFVEKDKLVVGICNGFQVLVSLGLLPATNKNYGKKEVGLLYNTNARFECRWIRLKMNSKKCIFTQGIDEIDIPIAHGEGNFYASKEILKKINQNDQVVFKYIKENGQLANGEFPYNPNGSLEDIAGICDETGRILGMMPHPERAIFTLNHPDYQFMKEKLIREGKKIPEIYEPALKVFQNAVSYFKVKV